jgi:hypothetical protein
MIPKIIHYCWFGGKEKPPLVIKCIESWKQHLPDYEIREWNDSNFNIKERRYTKEAYERGKFAFVSDCVRLFALYHFGGIYLDTDVEVFKSFNDLLHHNSFWGFEQEHFIATSTIGTVKAHPLIGKFLQTYEYKSFINEDGSTDSLTNVAAVTEILIKMGLQQNGEYQEIKGLGTFYPQEYFSPYDYINCMDLKTEYTYAKHYFYKSWLPIDVRIKTWIKKLAAQIIGGQNIAKIRRTFS